MILGPVRERMSRGCGGNCEQGTVRNGEPYGSLRLLRVINVDIALSVTAINISKPVAVIPGNSTRYQPAES